MRRWLSAAVVVAVALLALSAQPVVAANVALISQHTTASGFSNGSTSNATIVRSGDAGAVEHGTYRASAVARYPFDTGSGDTGYDHVGDNDATAFAGWGTGVREQGLDFDGVNDLSNLPPGLASPNSAFTTSFWINADNTSGRSRLVSLRYDLTFTTEIDDGQLMVWTGGTFRQATSVQTGTWSHIAVTFDGVDTWTVYKNGAQVLQFTNTPSSGNFDSKIGREVGSEGAKYYDGQFDELRIYDEQLKQSQVQDLAQLQTKLASGSTQESTYEASHAVTNSVEGYADLVLRNATATVRWEQSDGTLLAERTVSSSGNYTSTWNEYGGDSVTVNVTMTPTDPDHTARLLSEGVRAAMQAPTLDESSASPDGTAQSDNTLSINVTDPDFATVQSDQVTVEFRDAADGSLIGTDTLSANGTASTTWDGVSGGSNEWYATASDSYGGSAGPTQNFTWAIPSDLLVLNESDPTQKVDNATTTLRFYYENGTQASVVERETTNGTISMDGLPADESFVVVADADGYYPRRIYVPSLLETQKVYLLPDGKEIRTNLFTLSDFTGRYDKEESVLKIQRSLNGSWQTVQGDYFGATGEFSAQLRYNVRHRLVLVNTETGREEVLGSYTPVDDGEKSIRVTQAGEVEVVDEVPFASVSPGVDQLASVGEQSLSVRIQGGGSNLTGWTLTVEAVPPDGTTTQLASRTGDSSPARENFTLDTSSLEAGTTVFVNASYDFSDGTSTARTVSTYRIGESFDNDYSLVGLLGDVDGLVPERNVGQLTTMLAMLSTVLLTVSVAAVAPVSSELVGMTGVGSLAGFAVVGWVGFDVVFAAVIALIAFAALRRGL